MRGIFIAVGAAAINQFSWVFYLFGAVPDLHGVKLAKDDDLDGEHYDQPRIVKYAQTHLPVTESGTASSCPSRRTASGCSRRCSSSCSRSA